MIKYFVILPAVMFSILVLVSSAVAEEKSASYDPTAVDPSKEVPEHIQRNAPVGHALTGDPHGPGSEVEELKETEILSPDQAESEHSSLSEREQKNVPDLSGKDPEKSIESQRSSDDVK
ncbi:MAG: hypothetical protein NPIRA01_12260 [Nitrospirales bacterium]|nr:MAG: hypothetical protein NPIRA01_12260 [Nitrospirales bacterium]